MKNPFFYLLLFFGLIATTPSVSGQNKPCNNYECAYKKAETFLKNKEYQKALDNLDSAEGYLTDTNTKEKEQIKQLRRRLFVAIEKEKEDAKKARDEAKRQTEIAKAAEKKTRVVLGNTYFYDDKFGLAYDKSIKEYGFIDRDLKTKIAFKFSEALPFDYNGFAKVKDSKNTNAFRFSGNYYLIDTFGREYELVTDIKKLHLEIKALDLRNKELKEMPIFELNHKYKIEILLLGFNSLTTISLDIEKFPNLFFLDLSYNDFVELPLHIGEFNKLSNLNLHTNKIVSLPVEIEKLKNLKSLDLRGNPIPKEEQEKIKKLLPNCNIQF